MVAYWDGSAYAGEMCRGCVDCEGPDEVSQDGPVLIAAERARQVQIEGWTPAHDDGHADGTLTAAACCYAALARRQVDGAIQSPANEIAPPSGWPWDWDWWKPTDDPIRNLVKAGALIAAEIDRLQRNAVKVMRR